MVQPGNGVPTVPAAVCADVPAMARAIALAERGRMTVRPNPLVGCVLVRDGRIVGEGWHQRAGGPHAEIAALASCDDPRGATAYVTLEPCDHQGRTGPCSHALIDAGITRVAYAVADPDPAAAGGARTLRTAGLDVAEGLLGAWAQRQNEVFLHVRRTGRPFVTLKLAQTGDGRLALDERRWITGERARTVVHRQRARHDAVMVGSGTVLADDPSLDVRHVPAEGGQPRPVILDRRGRIPHTATVVRAGAIVVTTAASSDAWRTGLVERGAEVVVLPAQPRAPADGIDLSAALIELERHGVQSVYAEGGATLARSLVEGGHVDRLVLHLAGRDAGPHCLAPAIDPAAHPAGTWRWRTEASRWLGDDREITATAVTTSPQEA